MANGNRTGDPRGFDKGRSSKFRVGSRVRQKPEEGWRTYWLKHCGNNNKYEDSSPKTLNDKNLQASSKKIRQLLTTCVPLCGNGRLNVSIYKGHTTFSYGHFFDSTHMKL